MLAPSTLTLLKQKELMSFAATTSTTMSIIVLIISVPTNDLRELMQLILNENSFQFNGKHFVHTHGIAIETKMAVASSVNFMADLEKRLITSPHNPFVWKRYIDDIFSVWNCLHSYDRSF